MLGSEARSLWGLTAAASLAPKRYVADQSDELHLATLAAESAPSYLRSTFLNRSVLISGLRQLPAVLAMLSLDGTARRILLAPAGLTTDQIRAACMAAEIDVIVSDGHGPTSEIQNIKHIPATELRPSNGPPAQPTEWMLFTSGTSGSPKVAVHSLASLTGPLVDGAGVSPEAVWCTFYDVRRYGGLTILMRALLGGASMVLSQAEEPVGRFLSRAGHAGITHISGTPSHWRKALMSGAVTSISPNYVRLSGEIADQTILNNLASIYPKTKIAHAFASTEAGFAFDVQDGLVGFPSHVFGRTDSNIALKVQDGTLRIRSNRSASHYLGATTPLADATGFIDTGDLVEQRGDRFFFVGRREGVINVGGLKVFPEEVEVVINRHPAILMARVRGRPNPITGAIVIADVILQPAYRFCLSQLEGDIIAHCRVDLPAYKVPSLLHEVTDLGVSASGKMVRRSA
jgi:acyl-coenzyme A synthetase/AMP-(fatty) acid ligase